MSSGTRTMSGVSSAANCLVHIVFLPERPPPAEGQRIHTLVLYE